MMTALFCEWRGYYAAAFTEGADIHFWQPVFGLDNRVGRSVL